jgi:hypothetical protein
VTVFLPLSTRSAAGLQRLLGEDFAGILGSDRWTAYNDFDPSRRQVWWAHLKRDFQALFERGGESRVIGKLLLKQTELMFSYWHPQTGWQIYIHCLLRDLPFLLLTLIRFQTLCYLLFRLLN